MSIRTVLALMAALLGSGCDQFIYARYESEPISWFDIVMRTSDDGGLGPLTDDGALTGVLVDCATTMRIGGLQSRFSQATGLLTIQARSDEMLLVGYFSVDSPNLTNLILYPAKNADSKVVNQMAEDFKKCVSSFYEIKG